MLAPANGRPVSNSCYATSIEEGMHMSDATNKLPLSVLIVEDELHDFLTSKRKLERLVGYDVSIERASSVVEARTKSASKKFDVALVDMRLRGDTGIRVLCDLKASRPYTALILLSSISDAEMRNCALRSGALHCIEKDSCTPEILETTIQCALHSVRLERDLRDSQRRLEDALQYRTQNLSSFSEKLKMQLTDLASDTQALEADMSLKHDGATRGAISGIVEKTATTLSILKDITAYELVANHLDTAAFGTADLNNLVEGVLESKRLECLDDQHSMNLDYNPGPLPIQCQSAAFVSALLTSINIVKHGLSAGEGFSLTTRRSADVAVFEVVATATNAESIDDSTASATSLKVSGIDVISAKEIIARHGGTWTVTDDVLSPRKVVIALPLSLTVVH